MHLLFGIHGIGWVSVVIRTLKAYLILFLNQGWSNCGHRGEYFAVLSHLNIFSDTVYHHHHKHPGLSHLARSVSRVTVALSIVSSVSQLFSYLVGCSEMILKGFGFVAFFAGVKASSFCIHLTYLVFCLSVVRGEWSRLFCGHKGRKTNDSIRRELQTDNIQFNNIIG
jgi:hypothetical protein